MIVSELIFRQKFIQSVLFKEFVEIRVRIWVERTRGHSKCLHKSVVFVDKPYLSST